MLDVGPSPDGGASGEKNGMHGRRVEMVSDLVHPDLLLVGIGDLDFFTDPLKHKGIDAEEQSVILVEVQNLEV